jgi:hypothetical protein
MPTQAEHYMLSRPLSSGIQCHSAPIGMHTSSRFPRARIDRFADGSACVANHQPDAPTKYTAYVNVREATAALLLEGMALDMAETTGATVVECRVALKVQTIKLSVLSGQMTFDEGEIKLAEYGATMLLPKPEKWSAR